MQITPHVDYPRSLIAQLQQTSIVRRSMTQLLVELDRLENNEEKLLFDLHRIEARHDELTKRTSFEYSSNDDVR